MNTEYKVLKFKSRRGMLELDLLLSKYLECNYNNMSEDLKVQYISLMDLTDPELLDLLINKNNIDSLDSFNQGKYSNIKDVIIAIATTSNI